MPAQLLATSQVNTNAAPLLHAITQQLGFNLSEQQIGELTGAAILATRYAHIEGPNIKAATVFCASKGWQAAKWVTANGGVIPLAKKFLGIKSTVQSPASKGGITNLGQ